MKVKFIYTQKEAMQLRTVLEKRFLELYGVDYDFEVLPNKKCDYWKVVTHEFTHTAYNYGHCPDDNPTCIMMDAKGKADFSNKNNFCKTCRENINI